MNSLKQPDAKSSLLSGSMFSQEQYANLLQTAFETKNTKAIDQLLALKENGMQNKR